MRDVALLLPGQGSQRTKMATALYEHDEVFTLAMDEIFSALGSEGRRLRSDWLSPSPTLPIDHPQRSQPLLFAIDYAYGSVVRSWGICPTALLGHSVGEVAAAVLADVFTAADAATFIWCRMENLSGAAPGGMLAVSESAENLKAYLHSQVVVGAVNAPRQTILAGPERPLAEIAATLTSQGIITSPVASLVPFHSPVLKDYARRELSMLENLPCRPPSTTVISCYTATTLTEQEMIDPAYWASHPVAPVMFWPALNTLLASGDHVLVEAGPGQALTSLARRDRAVRAGQSRAIPLSGLRPEQDREALAQGRSELHALLAG